MSVITVNDYVYPLQRHTRQLLVLEKHFYSRFTVEMTVEQRVFSASAFKKNQWNGCLLIQFDSTPMNKFAISFKSLDEVRFAGIVLRNIFVKQKHRQLLVILQKIHKETVPRVLHFFSTTATTDFYLEDVILRAFVSKMI